MLLVLSSVTLLAQSESKWNSKNSRLWFEKGEWMSVEKAAETEIKYDNFGRVLETPVSDQPVRPLYVDLSKLTPHFTINTVEFAKQFHANTTWWNKAFAYLQQTDIFHLSPGRYPIDGDNVFAIITEDLSKDYDYSRWESHKRYADIHYIINGKENIGIAPVAGAKISKDYDPENDLTNYKTNGNFYLATPLNFFIMFPGDAHLPNCKTDETSMVKKIVIKIKLVARQ